MTFLFIATFKHILNYIKLINLYLIMSLLSLKKSHCLNYLLFTIRKSFLIIYPNIHYLTITHTYLPFMFLS